MTDPKLTELLRKVAESKPYTVEMAHADGAHSSDPWFAQSGICPECTRISKASMTLAEAYVKRHR